jgi:hypothetical protein
LIIYIFNTVCFSILYVLIITLISELKNSISLTHALAAYDQSF